MVCEVVKRLLSADLAWEEARPVIVQLPLSGWVGRWGQLRPLRLPVDGHPLRGEGKWRHLRGRESWEESWRGQQGKGPDQARTL